MKVPALSKKMGVSIWKCRHFQQKVTFSKKMDLFSHWRFQEKWAFSTFWAEKMGIFVKKRYRYLLIYSEWNCSFFFKMPLKKSRNSHFQKKRAVSKKWHYHQKVAILKRGIFLKKRHFQKPSFHIIIITVNVDQFTHLYTKPFYPLVK